MASRLVSAKPLPRPTGQTVMKFEYRKIIQENTFENIVWQQNPDHFMQA